MDKDLDSFANLFAQGLKVQGYTCNFGAIGTGLGGTGITSNAPLNIQYNTWHDLAVNIGAGGGRPRFYDNPFAGLGKSTATKDSAITGISARDANGNFAVVGYGFSTTSPTTTLAVSRKGQLTVDSKYNLVWNGTLSLPLTFPTGTTSTAFSAVTADGTKGAGYYLNGTSFQPFTIDLPTLVSPGGPPINLPLLPGVTSGKVTAMSPDGKTLVGDNPDPFGTNPQSGSCTLWFYGGTPQTYSPQNIGKVAGSLATHSSGISADGKTVVGFSTDQNGLSHSMSWNPLTGFVDLGAGAPAGSTNGQAFAATADGSEIVGFGAFGTNGYTWTKTGGIQYLPYLTGLVYSVSQCVSSDGAFVGGGSYGAAFTTPTAVIWTSSGTIYNLQGLLTAMGNDLTGWSLNQVTAIAKNSDGTYLFAGNGTHNGVAEGFVFQLGVATGPPPVIAAQPQSQAVGVGGTAVFSISATDATGYQWQRNGVNVPGAAAATPTLTIANAQTANAGNYTCLVTNAAGTVTTAPAALTVAPTVARLTNLSVRSTAGTGANTLIVGLTISGGTKQILFRGVGATLGLFGVPATLADPQLALFNSTGVQIAQNDDWGGGAPLTTAFANVGAFALPAASKDSALLATLPAGGYSAQVSGAAGTTGVVLVESYDSDPGSPAARYTNLSARNQVGTGANILIVGFNLTGNGPKNLLIRGVGLTLGQFGVPGALADPQLALFNSSSVQIGQNDDWGGGASLAAAFTSVGAFALPAASKDSALLVTLQPGSYTAQVSGVNNSTGVALVEIYELP